MVMTTMKKQLAIHNFKTYKLIYNQNGELKTDLDLLLSLKEWRSYIMKRDRLPSTCIFYNATLVTFATYFPQTQEEFLKAFGAGKRKWQKYGSEIVKIIKEHLINKKIGEETT